MSRKDSFDGQVMQGFVSLCLIPSYVAGSIVGPVFMIKSTAQTEPNNDVVRQDRKKEDEVQSGSTKWIMASNVSVWVDLSKLIFPMLPISPSGVSHLWPSVRISP